VSAHALFAALVGALTRAPDHRAPAATRPLREVSDEEIVAALAAAGEPGCTDEQCDCGGARRLVYKPRRPGGS